MYGMAGYVVETACGQSDACRAQFGSTWESGMAKIFETVGMTATAVAADIVEHKSFYEENGKVAHSHLR